MWQGWAAGTAVCYVFGTVWLAGPAGNQLYGWAGAGVIPYLPGGCRENSAGCIDRADTQEGNTEAEQTIEAQRIVKDTLPFTRLYAARCEQ